MEDVSAESEVHHVDEPHPGPVVRYPAVRPNLIFQDREVRRVVSLNFVMAEPRGIQGHPVPFDHHTVGAIDVHADFHDVAVRSNLVARDRHLGGSVHRQPRPVAERGTSIHRDVVRRTNPDRR